MNPIGKQDGVVTAILQRAQTYAKTLQKDANHAHAIFGSTTHKLCLLVCVSTAIRNNFLLSCRGRIQIATRCLEIAGKPANRNLNLKARMRIRKRACGGRMLCPPWKVAESDAFAKSHVLSADADELHAVFGAPPAIVASTCGLTLKLHTHFAATLQGI